MGLLYDIFPLFPSWCLCYPSHPSLVITPQHSARRRWWLPWLQRRIAAVKVSVASHRIYNKDIFGNVLFSENDSLVITILYFE